MRGKLPRIQFDLMKGVSDAESQVFDLTPYFQGRVGDSKGILPMQITMNTVPMDMSEITAVIQGHDHSGQRQRAYSDWDNDRFPGDSMRSGLVTFQFPAGLFQVQGYWQDAWIEFRRASDNAVLSSVNVKLNVLDNTVDMGINSGPIMTDLDKIKQDAQDKMDALIEEEQGKAKSLNDTMTADYDSYKQRIQNMETLLDTIDAAIKNKDVATREYVAKYIAGDLLGTATVQANPDELYPEGRIRVYTYGAGVPQTDVDMAGGSSVYEAQCRLVYISPELIQVYVSTEQLADLMPGWSMTTPPEVATGGDTAYLTAGVCSLAIQLKGVKSFNSFAVDGNFQVSNSK